jgi:hypothetical protein
MRPIRAVAGMGGCAVIDRRLVSAATEDEFESPENKRALPAEQGFRGLFFSFILIMSSTPSAQEETQLTQTIEMFEVITQTQPLDCQSLEILKEAYTKLGRHSQVLATSKRIASAYVQLGQLSSAILEYESVLQAYPEDEDVKTALTQIEQRATNFSSMSEEMEELEKPSPRKPAPSTGAAARLEETTPLGDIEDGREAMFKIFVDGKHVSEGDFKQCWPSPTDGRLPGQIDEPFVQMLAQRQILPVETALKLICERTRLAFLPIEKYDVDVELARSFARETCQRWCVLPFDRLGKSLLVATANPFHKHAARELEKAAKNHVLWYLTPPQDLIRVLRRIFR